SDAGHMKCDTLQLTLSDNELGFDELYAQGGVRIKQQTEGGQRVISGDSATYNTAADVFSVEGREVVIDDTQNTIRCTRAEFHISENVYVIIGNLAQILHYPAGKNAKIYKQFNENLAKDGQDIQAMDIDDWLKSRKKEQDELE
ncbi:hypothetical protein ACFL27_21495, partial [candidate division CSSED10-310 bacterium]